MPREERPSSHLCHARGNLKSRVVAIGIRRQCVTFRPHPLSESAREISRDGGGIQCHHYDVRKTNLEKFLRCIRCLTSRWLRGTKIAVEFAPRENPPVSRDKFHGSLKSKIREKYARSKLKIERLDDFIDRVDLSSYCDFGFIFK